MSGSANAKDWPTWLRDLDEEDLHFLKRFLLFSGSLKDLAEDYGVSYPTVRTRLDRLIAKVQAGDDCRIKDPFERKLRVLAADYKISASLAKELLQTHRAALERRNET